mgnify:CR=1 FL=1
MTNKSHDDDVAFIKALAELLRDNDLTELQVKRDYAEDDSLNVRVSRQTVTVAPAMVAPAAQAALPAAAPAAVPAAAASAAPTTASDPAQDPNALTSPMVGTAYLQPEPGAKSFVSPGDTVKEGQTVLIIEAMKTMNQIAAPKSGKVTRIFVEDGSPVEYGAPLMIIE